MEKFNDTLGDLSQFNVLSFEEVNQGFKGTQNSFTKIQQAPQRGKTIRGLKNVSPLVQFKFHNQSSDDIFNKYFPDGIDEHKDNINIITDYNITKNEYNFNTYNYYFDTNNNKTYGDLGDKLAFRLLIFISDDGNKVKECYEVTKPADDEVILFLETDEDLLSKRVLYGKMSKKVRALFTNKNGELNKELFDNDVMESVKVHVSDLNREVIEELMKKGYIENKYIPKEFFTVFKYTIMTNFAPAKAMGWISNKIGEIIDLLKTPDYFWDTENADYLFSKENLIENLSISTDKIATLKNLLSDKKGFDLADLMPDKLEKIILKYIEAIEQFAQNYNTTIRQYIHHLFENIDGKSTQMALHFVKERIALACGFWNGLVDFVSSIFKFVGGILEAPFNMAQDFQETLETIDNFLEALGSKEFWENLWNAIGKGIDNFKETLKDSHGDINLVRAHYVAGFTIAFVGTFFIPIANIGKIASVGKLGEISTVLTEITQTIGKAIRKTAKFAKDKAIKALQYLLNLIKTGGEKLQNFVDDIWKRIIAWFVERNKKFKSLVNQLLKKDSKTDELFRRVNKKFNLAGEKILSSQDIKKLRRLLKKEFDVVLEFVDQSPKLKIKLKDWKRRRVAGSFNMIEGVMYLRKSVTAHTVQHEMYHMKLWYKMTKEFPELQPIFQKTLGRQTAKELFHEEYVLAEFMKNPSKWKEADLLNDLTEINKLRLRQGLQKVNLEYYRKWNLEQELLKFK